jgi:hypothetical protein
LALIERGKRAGKKTTDDAFCRVRIGWQKLTPSSRHSCSTFGTGCWMKSTAIFQGKRLDQYGGGIQRDGPQKIAEGRDSGRQLRTDVIWRLSFSLKKFFSDSGDERFLEQNDLTVINCSSSLKLYSFTKFKLIKMIDSQPGQKRSVNHEKFQPFGGFRKEESNAVSKKKV